MFRVPAPLQSPIEEGSEKMRKKYVAMRALSRHLYGSDNVKEFRCPIRTKTRRAANRTKVARPPVNRVDSRTRSRANRRRTPDRADSRAVRATSPASRTRLRSNTQLIS